MHHHRLRALFVAALSLAACAPDAPADHDAAVTSDQRDAALADAPASELWAPAELSVASPYLPLRLVTQDPALVAAPLVLTTDRDVGVISPTARMRFREVDGWFYGTNGPGFSYVEDGSDVFGPLTFSLRRADDPAVVVATATTNLVPATSEPSADACLGGGNVVVWEKLGSYGGATGAMVQIALGGRFDATVRDIDYVGDRFREMRVQVDEGSFALRTPRGAEPPSPLVLGEIVHGEVRFPGACSDFEGEFVVLDFEEGQRFSPLRARAARLTVAWRGSCRGGPPVELRGCAHFDAESPQL